MFLPWYSSCVRLSGRWSRQESSGVPARFTTATAPGSYFEAAYTGKDARFLFDLGYLGQPYPHLYVSVDGGALTETPVDRYLWVRAPKKGNHVVKVLYKGGMEMLPRWYAPLMGAVSFIGLEADSAGILPPDERRIIEFVGDSITEGVLIDADYSEQPANSIDQWNRPYQDDNTATYAAITARNLNLRPIFQAYGAVGLTRSGCGSVPRAGLIYPYVFDGVPYTGKKPDYVVINHGANDRGTPAEQYIARYEELLDLIGQSVPNAQIVCLVAFCGAFDSEIRQMVLRRAKSQEHFISTMGWLPKEPLHPLRDGHQIASMHLTEELIRIFPELKNNKIPEENV